MIVVPEEAEIVKMIFADYLSGMGAQAIAKKLNNLRIPTKHSDCWRSNTILKLIHNEKYIGNMLLQITFRPDFRTKKGYINHGEMQQYYVENSHQPIISCDTFNAVQEEAEHRRKHLSNSQVCHKDAKPNLFTGIIVCGLCGSIYKKRTAHSKPKPQYTWICNKYFELGKSACPSQQIPEDILVEKTKEVLGVDSFTRDTLLDQVAKIEVTDHFHLRYTLKDGSVHHVTWQHKSRKNSWTKEMKEAARQRTIEQRRKEKK